MGQSMGRPSVVRVEGRTVPSSIPSHYTCRVAPDSSVLWTQKNQEQGLVAFAHDSLPHVNTFSFETAEENARNSKSRETWSGILSCA